MHPSPISFVLGLFHHRRNEMTRGRTILALLLTGTLAICDAGVALASGGKSVATARLVVSGRHESGNLATATASPCYGRYYTYPAELWTLHVRAGDHVTINWSTQNGGMNLLVEPVGTSDYSLANATPFATDQTYINSSTGGSSRLTFGVNRRGAMPVEFCGGRNQRTTATAVAAVI
jgi:hypothetical protein